MLSVTWPGEVDTHQEVTPAVSSCRAHADLAGHPDGAQASNVRIPCSHFCARLYARRGGHMGEAALVSEHGARGSERPRLQLRSLPARVSAVGTLARLTFPSSCVADGLPRRPRPPLEAASAGSPRCEARAPGGRAAHPRRAAQAHACRGSRSGGSDRSSRSPYRVRPGLPSGGPETHPGCRSTQSGDALPTGRSRTAVARIGRFRECAESTWSKASPCVTRHREARHA